MKASAELWLIRHAEAETGGRMTGRRDVDLSGAGQAALKRLSGSGAEVTAVWCSPARRCTLTAKALWPKMALHEDARLWEQDFGAWDGMAYGDLPDLGDLSRAALAEFAAPGGESFRALCNRAFPVLEKAAAEARIAGPVALVAHAGIVRAGLAMALGDVPQALAFEVDPLSLTRLRCLPEGLSIRSVNGALP